MQANTNSMNAAGEYGLGWLWTQLRELHAWSAAARADRRRKPQWVHLPQRVWQRNSALINEIQRCRILGES